MLRIRSGLLLLLTCIYCLVSGQENVSTFSKFMVGFNFSPDFCYSTKKITIPEAQDGVKWGTTQGVSFLFKPNKKIGFEAGINYANKGYQTLGLIYGNMIKPQNGAITRSAEKSEFYYVSLPLKVNYMIGNGKLRFISSAGISPGVLLSSKKKQVIKYENGAILRTEEEVSRNFKQFNLFSTISIGIQYHLKDKISIRIEPNLSYGLLQVSPNQNLYSIGVNVGFYYGL